MTQGMGIRVLARPFGIALVALVAACGPQKIDAVPDALLGVWKTRGARYENRFLEIRPDVFVLGVAKLDMDKQAIEFIEHERDADGKDVYHLHYTADGGYADTLVLTRFDTATPALRVGEIPHLWTRVDAR